jgi:hypothetical protein
MVMLMFESRSRDGVDVLKCEQDRCVEGVRVGVVMVTLVALECVWVVSWDCVQVWLC